METGLCLVLACLHSTHSKLPNKARQRRRWDLGQHWHWHHPMDRHSTRRKCSFIHLKVRFNASIVHCFVGMSAILKFGICIKNKWGAMFEPNKQSYSLINPERLWCCLGRVRAPDVGCMLCWMLEDGGGRGEADTRWSHSQQHHRGHTHNINSQQKHTTTINYNLSNFWIQDNSLSKLSISITKHSKSQYFCMNPDGYI